MLRLVRLLGLVVPLLLAVAMVQPAAAQTTPPSLTGELFGAECSAFPPSGFTCVSAGHGSATTTCALQPDGTAVLSFSVTQGIASGPYPGTFSESGIYTLGAAGSGGAGVGERVTAFRSTFSIQSPVGTVGGTKAGTTAQQALTAHNFCTAFPGQLDTFAGAFASYDATIQTAQGPFRDTGQTLAQVSGAGPRGPSGFFETLSSNGVVPLSCNQEQSGEHDPGCQFGPNK